MLDYIPFSKDQKDNGKQEEKKSKRNEETNAKRNRGKKKMKREKKEMKMYKERKKEKEKGGDVTIEREERRVKTESKQRSYILVYQCLAVLFTYLRYRGRDVWLRCTGLYVIERLGDATWCDRSLRSATHCTSTQTRFHKN